VWVIALGKAAHPMCGAALDALRRLTLDVAGGMPDTPLLLGRVSIRINQVLRPPIRA
jgi:hypothetical protein